MFRLLQRIRTRRYAWAPFVNFSDRRVFGALMTFDRR